MKLYLAAPYVARDFIRESVAPRFTRNGHTLTSEWLHATRAITPATLGTSPATSDADVMYHAGKDLEEVRAADVLVHFTAAYLGRTTSLPVHQMHTGGRHVETGYALALSKSVIVLGDPENIFQRGLCHPARHMFDVLELLKEMDELADYPQM